MKRPERQATEQVVVAAEQVVEVLTNGLTTAEDVDAALVLLIAAVDQLHMSR